MGGDCLSDEGLAGKKGRKRLAGGEMRESHEGSNINLGKPAIEGKSSDGVTVSTFDCSVENHFQVMDMISKLCRAEEEEEAFDTIEMERMSSTITFLREWKQYYYKPRIVKFTSEIGCLQGKLVVDGANFPQFSAANVPKMESLSSDAEILDTGSKDFVLYVGGPVWALDWCPTVQQRSDVDIKCEYLAVAAHPPESSYHKIGAPLTGRGIVQIWCLLNVSVKEEEELPLLKKQRGRPRKSTAANRSLGASDSGNHLVQECGAELGNVEEKQLLPPFKKARGRPRKEKAMKKIDNVDQENECIHALGAPLNTAKVEPSLPKRGRGRPKKKKVMEESTDNLGQFDPVLAVDESPKFLPTTMAAGNMEDQAVLRGCDKDRLGIETKENCSNELPKRGKGRPKKNKVMKEPSDNLGKDDQFDPVHAVEESLQFLATTVAPGNTEGKPVLRDRDKNGLKSENKENCSNELPKRGRGRPKKKKVVKESLDNLGRNEQFDPIHAVEESPQFRATTVAAGNMEDQAVLRGCDSDGLGTKTKENFFNELPMCRSLVTPTQQPLVTPTRHSNINDVETLRGNNDDKSSYLLTENNDEESSTAALQTYKSCGQDMRTSSEKARSNLSLEINSGNSHLPKDVALPRVVLCLAHNGKVALDVKWRPFSISGFEHRHRMGYLAVLLGNGSVEVWDVPSPSAIKVLYSSCQKDGTDPRFVKLEPVFKCSKLKCGDRQSMPLAVEWSPTFPHDLILVGCHDGTVALWKFVASGSPQDTRPLLCFSADTLPIRALAWAPKESGEESAHLIATGGHGGLRFWDIRDPYRPLWSPNSVRQAVYSLDWLSDPRCVILSLDDGTLKILSLSRAAYDVPVTGKPFVGTMQQGLFSFFCSSFPIWSVQASRLTGLVAYCCSDGLALHFQLTTKAVDKDHSRNRAPHFLCGSLTEEETGLVVNTPVPNTPMPNIPVPMNQAKRANSQVPNYQALAICYGDDPSLLASTEDATTACENKSAKLKPGKKKEADPELECSPREGTENLERGEKNEKTETGAKIDVFPPKIVAMHRVRWNMNKGSEKWLCYGGAAGIVRLQEISLSSSLVRR